MRSKFYGQTIKELEQWIKDNPTYIGGCLERYKIIKEIQDNPYAHYYGYNKPID